MHPVFYILLYLIFGLLTFGLLLKKNDKLIKKEISFKKFLKKRKEKKENVIDFDSEIMAVERVLSVLNIEFTKKDDEEKITYYFDYQSGHFTLSCPYRTITGMRLVYPGFAITQLDNIDSVRILCNETNRHSFLVNAMYTLNNEENKIVLHFIARLAATDSAFAFEREFKQATLDCFGLHKYANEHLNSLIEASQKNAVSDLEYKNACDERIEKILLETEKRHSEIKNRFSADIDEVTEEYLNIQTLLRFLIGGNVKNVTFLEVTADNYHITLTKERDILSYIIATPLIGTSNEDGKKSKTFLSKRAVIYLEVEQSSKENEKNDGITLGIYFMLEAVKKTNEALYFRLNYQMSQHIVAHSQSTSAVEAVERPYAGNFLLSYNLVEIRKKKMEFDYMYHDAQDKYANGQKEECTPEQRLIYNLTNPDIGFNLYWGNHYMREGLYLEATIRLERAWNILNKTANTIKEQEQPLFYYISYLTGLCLMHLGLYKEAYYYLEFTQHTQNTDYIKALINCMIMAKDCRVLKMIKSSLSYIRGRIRASENEEEGIPSFIIDYYNFLRRREIYVDIENHYFEEAESLCKAMLTEQENMDYALSELAHLQQLRASGIKNVTPPINDNDTDNS